ncbi:ubiquitin carboxyl-terminal hydrolase 35, partial [Biomphalaria glabrata]
HEEESMDKILEGVIESQQPEGLKLALINRICDQGSVPDHPAATVKGIFQVSSKWIMHGTTTLQVSSGFNILYAWGIHNLDSFQAFFTPSYVAQVMVPGIGIDGNAPLLIRHGLRVISQGQLYSYSEHSQMVQKGVVKFLHSTSDRLVVRNIGLLLQEFTECIPTEENRVIDLCLAVLQRMSRFSPPQDGTEVIKFINLTDGIGTFLSFLWKLHPGTISICLEEIFKAISTPRIETEDSAINFAAVVKHIPIDRAHRAVKDVLDDSVPDTSIAAAVGQIVEWLKWPTAANVDLWLSCFLKEVTLNKKFSLLAQITTDNIEQVVENLSIPAVRHASFKILSQMLLNYHHSPKPFHKALEKIPSVVTSLRKEASAHSLSLLAKLAELMYCLMYQHTGFPELYEPALELIKDFPPLSQEAIKQMQTKWSPHGTDSEVPEETVASIALHSSVANQKLEPGKTGLENLGNTCYMNSILQALYMCDQFRRGVLNKAPSGKESLLVKLQHVFASMCQSSRPAIAPTKFLQASRPPWFQPGHQQDCSEFLKYLLDQLHEDEKTNVLNRSISKSPSSSSLSSNNSYKISEGSLGKSSKKAAVMLTGIKMMSDDEMNGCSSPDSDKVPMQPLTLVESTFRGRMQTTIRCLGCQQESHRVETFSDIPLAFPNSSKSIDRPHQTLAGGSGLPCGLPESPQSDKTLDFNSSQESSKPPSNSFTLNDLISFYLKPEKLIGDNKYHCDNCRTLQDGERRIQILESPQYLILTLLRFSYDTKLQSRTKIFQDVQYPRTLAVPVCKAVPASPMDSKSNPFSRMHSRSGSQTALVTTKSSSQLSQLENIAQRLAPPCEGAAPAPEHCDLYGLSAVIIHSGTSSECGHYYCYARHSQAGQIDLSLLDRVTSVSNLDNLDLLPDKWYNFNDNRVSHAHFETFSNLTKRFSKDTAYVLIYRKIDTEPTSVSFISEPPLRPDLRDAVIKDNETYMKEQEEEARSLAAQRKRSSSVNSTNLRNWRGDDDDDDDISKGGPPGCRGGLGDMDTTGSRFVF